jgi:hypothetical protein
MNLQKKINFIETYRTYQIFSRHTGREIEIQLMPGAVEKYHEKKNRPRG